MRRRHAGKGATKYEPAHALWICRRVEHRERASFGVPDEHCLFGVARVEHDAQVIHPLLVGRKLLHAVRKASPTLVEDHNGEARFTAQVLTE